MTAELGETGASVKVSYAITDKVFREYPVRPGIAINPTTATVTVNLWSGATAVDLAGPMTRRSAVEDDRPLTVTYELEHYQDAEEHGLSIVRDVVIATVDKHVRS